MARKLTVSHNGQTFTRTTDRIYTHAILVRPDYARVRAGAIAGAVEYARVNYDYYVQEADPATRKHDHDAATLARYAKIAAMTFEQYHRHASANAAAAVDARHAAGEFDRFGVLEWCGRNDLARNAHGKALKRGYAEVVIVEVPPDPPVPPTPAKGATA